MLCDWLDHTDMFSRLVSGSLPLNVRSCTANASAGFVSCQLHSRVPALCCNSVVRRDQPVMCRCRPSGSSCWAMLSQCQWLTGWGSVWQPPTTPSMWWAPKTHPLKLPPLRSNPCQVSRAPGPMVVMLLVWMQREGVTAYMGGAAQSLHALSQSFLKGLMLSGAGDA